MQTLECVPNLSEGRRLDIVDRLVERAGLDDNQQVNRTSDRDHHRTVLTWLGEPAALSQAAARLCTAALEEIDLQKHRGAHPRVGALDVVPSVPLGKTPMAVAVEAARATAQRIAETCDVPTFLYGEAATAPERRELARHRRSGFRNLSRRVAQGVWRPDYERREHPRSLHPTAGAVLVGARRILVAFNLFLDTNDARVARKIAEEIRDSSPSGLPGIKALGLLLRSRGGASGGTAQVSVNVTDVEATPLAKLVDRVVREARKLDTDVTQSELIGLAPKTALRGADAATLRLPSLDASQILETYLRESGPRR